MENSLPIAPNEAADHAIAVAMGAQRPTALPPVRLGEELPIFCERCGYSLHGLEACQCETCMILHFRCPECGHHQPINTLRPAFQRILGRMRSWVLALLVFIKINYFFWLFIAWGAMGYEWKYQYVWNPVAVVVPSGAAVSPGIQRAPRVPEFRARPIDWELLFVFAIFGLPFGLVSRMLLLRWKRGMAVGAILAALAAISIAVGAWLRYWEMSDRSYRGNVDMLVETPFDATLFQMASWAGVCIVFGAAIAWTVWYLLVRLLLPQRTASALLEWQESMSSDVAALAR